MNKLKSKNLNLGNIDDNFVHYKQQDVDKDIKIIEIRQWQRYGHFLAFLKALQRLIIKHVLYTKGLVTYHL